MELCRKNDRKHITASCKLPYMVPGSKDEGYVGKILVFRKQRRKLKLFLRAELTTEMKMTGRSVFKNDGDVECVCPSGCPDR
jgi:hypothetical protein